MFRTLVAAMTTVAATKRSPPSVNVKIISDVVRAEHAYIDPKALLQILVFVETISSYFSYECVYLLR